MGSSIIICEKNKQAQAIQRAVGTKYGRVYPAQGHILTLKEPDEIREAWSGKWTPGLLWPGSFYPKKPIRETKKKLDAIRDAARNADRIIIATDCDREGQLIGDEIVEYIGFKGQVLRCIFNAEDPKSLQDAFANLKPNEEFRSRYMSGQAREQADQTVNLSLTRTATACLKAPGAKGAIGIGRVKSPVLGIICQRELEIENFKPQDMYHVEALTAVAAGKFTLSCTKLPKSLVREEMDQAELEEEEEELSEDQAALATQENSAGKIMKREVAEGLRAAVEGYSGDLISNAQKKKQSPPKLFDLTSLQSAASSKFNWTGAKTLEIAQSLYSDRTLITYPRGEARYLPENNIADIPKLVPALLALPQFKGYSHLLQEPRVRKGKSGHFSDKALADVSHHAIIPNVNSASMFSSSMQKLSEDEAKLFELISRQYMAALAPDFEYRQTTITMEFPWKGHNWDFRTSGRVPLVPGLKEILGGAGAAKSDEQDLPPVERGEKGLVESAKLRTVTTKPPARYTEGSLMTIMQEAWRLVPPGPHRERLKEAKGIGTAATRADVPEGLLEQGQIVMKGKTFMPTAGGMQLYKMLLKVSPNIVDPARTAIWETIFDMVEKSKISAEDAVEKILGEAQKEIDNIVGASKSLEIRIGKSSKPSAKMINLAKSVAERKGIKLPPKCTTDLMVCRKFLDENLPKRDPDAPKGVYPPSEKQLAFANRLAEQIGVSIPEEAKTSSKVLSAWIDKAAQKAPPRPPSAKQMVFARKLAEENNVDLPEQVEKDIKACSAFIDKMMKKNSSSKSGSGKRKARA
jgi:DNA topoisomerase-3